MHYHPHIYTPRNDHKPGYIYLMEAVGYHGLFPGCYLKRCKIGLSSNPQLRLQNFIDNQPPCDIQIIRKIHVEDMADIEARLHNQFKHCKVKLTKSKEWFDLNPVDYLRVNAAFSSYSRQENKSIQPLNIIFSMLGISLLIMFLLSTQSKPQQQPQTKPAVIEGARNI
jgi:hypothetical protein